ncbi:MAG: sodium:proton antiporter [Mariprofundales bacterium]
MHTSLPIESLVLLLTLAVCVAIFSGRLRLPYTTALVLIGLVVSFTPLSVLHIEPGILFFIILPPLLFQGALHMELEDLLHHVTPVVILAIPGLLLSTAIVGLGLHHFASWQWVPALLFGALIAATDPISVLAQFKALGAPAHLKALVEGESLFNDGTAVVVFSILLAMGTSGADTEIRISAALGDFVRVAAGGAVIGLVFGYGVHKLLGTLNDHLLEVMITVALVFGAFSAAEHVHVSGVIAVVVAGLIIGNVGLHMSMSPKTRDTVETFWESTDFIVNSLLFMLIGLQLSVFSVEFMQSNLDLVGLAIVMCLFARAIAVYGTVALNNKLHIGNIIPFSWSHIMFWGGLRGSIPIALVMILPQNFPMRNEMMIMAFGVVLFSLVIQGVTMAPLLRALGIAK